MRRWQDWCNWHGVGTEWAREYLTYSGQRCSGAVVTRLMQLARTEWAREYVAYVIRWVKGFKYLYIIINISNYCYVSSYFTRIYYKIHGPVPQIHFLQRKRCGEIGPSECGRGPYSGGKSSELPTFPLSHIPTREKKVVWNSLVYSGVHVGLHGGVHGRVYNEVHGIEENS